MNKMVGVFGGAVFCAFGVWLCSADLFPSSGKCPVVSLPPNFNASKFLGVWFPYKCYPGWFDGFSTCNKFEFSNTPGDSTTITVSVSGKILGMPWSVPGTLLKGEANDPAKMTITVALFSQNGFWVVDTDYDSYCVVTQCTDLLGLHNENVCVLLRARDPQPTYQSALDARLKSLPSIKVANFVVANQKDNCS